MQQHGLSFLATLSTLAFTKLTGSVENCLYCWLNRHNLADEDTAMKRWEANGQNSNLANWCLLFYSIHDMLWQFSFWIKTCTGMYMYLQPSGKAGWGRLWCNPSSVHSWLSVTDYPGKTTCGRHQLYDWWPCLSGTTHCKQPILLPCHVRPHALVLYTHSILLTHIQVSTCNANSGSLCIQCTSSQTALCGGFSLDLPLNSVLWVSTQPKS